MINFKGIAIDILEKQGIPPSSVAMTIPGDFVHIQLMTPPEHQGGRSLSVNIRLDSDIEDNETWPTKTVVRWPEISDATAYEAMEMATLLAAASEIAASFDAATGAGKAALSYEETIARDLELAGLYVIRNKNG